jgi:hypothetical protein
VRLPFKLGGRPLRFAFWAAAVFAFVMAVLPHPPKIPGEPSDKVQHVAAFVTLGLLSKLAYPATAPLQLAVRLSLFGAFIEVVQAIPMLHRDSSVWDWVADTIACALVLAGVAWWQNRR